MKKISIVLSVVGFVAFAGVSRADEKSENSTKTETGTTLTGKKKITRSKKLVSPDGTTTESKTETVEPKSEKRDIENSEMEKRDDLDSRGDATVKTEHRTTLTGKREIKKSKKVENGDGSETTSTTTTTEPKK